MEINFIFSLQASILKKYPAELIIVFFYFFFVAIQSTIISLVVEGASSAWSLASKERLISIVYSVRLQNMFSAPSLLSSLHCQNLASFFNENAQGVFGSAFQVGISSLCLHRTGPVFVSMFKPLGLAIAVASGVLFFGDTFYLGRYVSYKDITFVLVLILVRQINIMYAQSCNIWW